MINFNAEIHQYTNDAGEVYISATQLIELFVPKFEDHKEFWLYYKTLQQLLGYNNDEAGKDAYKTYLKSVLKSEYRYLFAEKNILLLYKVANLSNMHTDVIVSTKDKDDEWKDTNKKALVKGTAFHNAIEAAQLGSSTYEFEHTKEKVSVIGDFSGNLLDIRTNGIIPELRIYNHKYRIAGTSDQPYFELPWFDINDWKTNKEIKTDNKWATMKYCLSHLPDCNFSHYNIQLSLYAWMLEQYGYRCRNIGITHILFHNDNTPSHHVYYPMKYLKKEIEEMLEYYDQHLRK